MCVVNGESDAGGWELASYGNESAGAGASVVGSSSASGGDVSTGVP